MRSGFTTALTNVAIKVDILAFSPINWFSFVNTWSLLRPTDQKRDSEDKVAQTIRLGRKKKWIKMTPIGAGKLNWTLTCKKVLKVRINLMET